jgi:hypothetical protein
VEVEVEVSLGVTVGAPMVGGRLVCVAVDVTVGGGVAEGGTTVFVSVAVADGVMVTAVA